MSRRLRTLLRTRLHRPTGRRGRKRSVLLLALTACFLILPAAPASADIPNPFDWLTVSPNDLCAPQDPVPEVAGTGLDGLIDPPGVQQPVTAYADYGMAGQSWHATELGCKDLPALIGNQAANVIFTLTKAVDRVTITAYQTAYSPGLFDGLSMAVTGVVKNLGNFLYLPYITPLVLLSVMWLAWHGLVRKRATMSVEGVIWMIIAVTCALWFLNRPQDILGAGNGVVTGATTRVMDGIAKAGPGADAGCFSAENEQAQAVDKAASALWTALVCKPWLAGEFGMAGDTGNGQDISTVLVARHGKGLLAAQAVSQRDLERISKDGRYDAAAAREAINAKHEAWQQIRDDLKQNYPSVYPLFQGRQWGTRLGISLAAFIAAIFAGALVLLVAVTLIVLKVGFLLLLMAGPFFLLVGIHPGVGRVVALRWVELLIGTLLKQIIVALVLGLLLFGYSVIVSPQWHLPWGVQILLLSLMGVAAFIYRKPFQHLFASVGVTGAYSTFGQRVVGEAASTNAELGRAHRRLGSAAATPVVGPPVLRRLTGRIAAAAVGGAVAGGVGAAAAGRASRGRPVAGGSGMDGGPGAAGAPAPPGVGGDEQPAHEEAVETRRAARDGSAPAARGAASSTGRGAAPPLGLAPRRGRASEPDGTPPRSAGRGRGAGGGSRAGGGSGSGTSRWTGGSKSGGSGGSAAGGSSAPRGTRSEGGGASSGSSWYDPDRGRGAARRREAPQRGREGPPLTAPARRPEAAPPLPFWLRPGDGRDDGEERRRR